MDQVVATVFYDGQFWVALIEKIGDDGVLSIGKYTFGAEPTNSELLYFTLHIYPFIDVIESKTAVRVKARKSINEETRQTNKARQVYAGLQKEYLLGRKEERIRTRERQQQERFLDKQQKKKEKKRGH